MKKDRVVYIDALRLIASLMVVAIHVTALYLYENIGIRTWQGANILNSFSRGAVPLFLMISGGLALSSKKTTDIKNLFTKRLPALLIPTICWSLLFALINHTLRPALYSFEKMQSQLSASWFQASSTHLEFMYQLISLTLISPFLYYVANHANSSVKTYALVWGLIAFILPATLQCFGVSFSLSTYFPSLFFGNILYYFLGHLFLHKTWNIDKLWCILGLLFCGGAVALGTFILSSRQDALSSTFYSYMGIFVFLSVLFLYDLVKQIPFKPVGQCRVSAFITKVGPLSGGAYFVHMFFVTLIRVYLFGKLPGLLIIPLGIVLTFVLSYGFSYLVSYVPVLRYVLLGLPPFKTKEP